MDPRFKDLTIYKYIWADAKKRFTKVLNKWPEYKDFYKELIDSIIDNLSWVAANRESLATGTIDVCSDGRKMFVSADAIQAYQVDVVDDDIEMDANGADEP